MKVINPMTGIDTPTLTYNWGNTYRHRVFPLNTPHVAEPGGSFTVYVGKTQ